MENMIGNVSDSSSEGYYVMMSTRGFKIYCSFKGTPMLLEVPHEFINDLILKI